MNLNVDMTPQEEARFKAFARQRGTNPSALAKQLLTDALPPALTTEPAIDDENTAAVAMLEGFLADSPTDPEAQAQAEADFAEFTKNLNENRVAAGERPLFP